MSISSWATHSRTLRIVLVAAMLSAFTVVLAAVPPTASAAPGDSFLAPGAQAGCYISQIPTGSTTTSLQQLNFNYQNNTATLSTSGTAPNDVHNSIGYNPVDGFIYGTELRNGVNYLIKIGQNGVVVNNAVLTLPNADPGTTTVFGYFSGTVDSSGMMYITGVGTTRYVTINLNTLTATMGTLSVAPVGNGDWAITNGVLYTASRNGNVIAYNPATGAQIPALSKTGALPAATGSSAFYGAGFTLQNGQVVFVDNTSGNSYMYNPATQTATLVATVPPTGQNDGTCIPSTPSIALTKTGPTEYQAGVPVTYTFTAVNKGNVTTSNVAVNDPLLATNSIAVTCPSSTLAPGASETCTSAPGYVITQADVDAGSVSNTATAQGTPPGSSTPVVTPPSTAVTPTTSQPSIALTKTPSTNALVAGHTITYTLVATNTGDVTLSGVSIAEGSFTGSGAMSALSCSPTQPATLAPGAKVTCTATYVVTQADVDAGTIVNHASATGNPPTGSPVSATAEATIPSTSTPALSLRKRVARIVDANHDRITDAGDEIFYEFRVTNTGSVTMSAIQVTDPLLRAHRIAASCPVSTLAPGASETCTATSGYVITQADVDAGGVTNTATAKGTPPGSSTPVTSPPSSTHSPTAYRPGLTLLKRFGHGVDVNHDGYVDTGDQLWWTFLVTNTGDVSVHGLQIHDPVLDTQHVSVVCNPSTLKPGASVLCVQTKAYIVTASDQARGYVKNVAIGTAFGPHGSLIGTNQSTVVTRVSGPPITQLPNTGGPSMAAWLAAIMSLSGGLALMWVGRRRRTQ